MVDFSGIWIWRDRYGMCSCVVLFNMMMFELRVLLHLDARWSRQIRDRLLDMVDIRGICNSKYNGIETAT